MPEVKDLSTTTPNLRRKLIRGAFAAPSLMTVYSGGAFAASSHLRGLVNANANPVEPTAIIDGQDTYARVELHTVESTENSVTVTKYYVRGEDLGSYTRSANIPDQFHWLQFSPSDPYDPVGSIVGQGSTSTPSGKFITVRFDENGHIAGLGGSFDGAVVTNSVLTSATPFIV